MTIWNGNVYLWTTSSTSTVKSGSIYERTRHKETCLRLFWSGYREPTANNDTSNNLLWANHSQKILHFQRFGSGCGGWPIRLIAMWDLCALACTQWKSKAEQFRSKAAWSKLLLHLYFSILEPTKMFNGICYNELAYISMQIQESKTELFVPCCHVGFNRLSEQQGADHDSGKVSTNTNHLNAVLKHTLIYPDRHNHKHPAGRCCFSSSTWMTEITHTYSLHLHLIYFYSIIIHNTMQWSKICHH